MSAFKQIHLLCIFCTIGLADSFDPLDPFQGHGEAFFNSLRIEQPIVVKRDIPFCKPAPGVVLKMHVAYPKGTAILEVPGVILFHWGGFRSGHPDSMLPLAKVLAGKGYVAFAVSTRLSGDLATDNNPKNNPYQVQAKFPKPLEDAYCAIRFIRDNANQYKVDPNRLAAWGIGSGAYFAMWAGLAPPTNKTNRKGDIKEDSKKRRDNVEVIINWFGPLDLTTQYFHEEEWGNPEFMLIRSFLGTTPLSVPEIYRTGSAINYAHKESAAMLSFYPTQGQRVPFQEAARANKHLNKVMSRASILVPVASATDGFFVEDEYIPALMYEITKSSVEFLDEFFRESSR